MCLCVQEESTNINVRNYWPSVVASGAMLLATDAISRERTLGSYILSVCDFSTSQLSLFAYLQGSSDLLLKFASTYDARASQLLDQYIYSTPTQRNLTTLRHMILDDGASERCYNMTDQERTRMIVTWADPITVYVLTVDELRSKYIIPYILQVSHGDI